MRTLNEIKQNIKETAESVKGIGKVYDRFIYAFDAKQVKDLFASDHKINVLMFRFIEREAEGGESILTEINARRTWKFRLVIGYNFENNSEKTLDDLCENICNVFNSDSLLNSCINKKTFLNITDKYDSEYNGILVHNAEMEMETT